MKRFAVQLEGGLYDLKCLADCDWHDADVQGETGGKWFLTSETFEHLPDSGAVYPVAKELVRRLNDAAHLAQARYQPVRMLPKVLDYDKENTFLGGENRTATGGNVNITVPEPHVTNFGTATFHGGGTFDAKGSNAGPPPPPLAVRANALRSQHKAIDDALRAVGTNDWVGWRKVVEIVRGHDKAVLNGCVTDDERNRFRDTANHPSTGDKAAHARSRHPPPENPMSEHEGRAFAHRLIECLVRDIESRSDA